MKRSSFLLEFFQDENTLHLNYNVINQIRNDTWNNLYTHILSTDRLHHYEVSNLDRQKNVAINISIVKYLQILEASQLVERICRYVS